MKSRTAPSKKTTPTEQEAAAHIVVYNLEKAGSMVQHLDTQTSILIGLTSALFVFSISQDAAEISPELTTLGAFSAIATIIGLYSVHPPKFMRKRGQKESFLYNGTIARHGSQEAFGKALASQLRDYDGMMSQCATEMYNMAVYCYRPKRELYKAARNVFLLGIIVSLLVLIVQSLG